MRVVVVVGNIGGTFTVPVLMVPQAVIGGLGRFQVLPRYVHKITGEDATHIDIAGCVMSLLLLLVPLLLPPLLHQSAVSRSDYTCCIRMIYWHGRRRRRVVALNLDRRYALLF